MAGEKSAGSIKIVGYLEKKGKLKVVNTWKKYWFVLEGRLLLYYRSQEEYENLSPCKGSINIGLVTNIRPGIATAGVFQIVTRTNTVTLRAKERSIQEKWLQALLDATGQQTASNPIKMSHFRYSMDDLIPTGAKQKPNTQTQQPVLARQNTLPRHFKVDRRNSIIDRIRLIGGQTYGGSLDTINQLSKIKTDATEKAERKMSEKSLAENDLYAGVFIENVQYEATRNTDHNKNCYIIENDQYIKSESVSSQSSRPEDIEYYCTYEEVLSSPTKLNGIYSEPDLPPRPEGRKISESEESQCSSKEEKKKSSKFSRFARRLKSLKPSEDSSLKKRSASLIMKVMGKKRTNEPVVEPIYDTVDYLEIDNLEVEDPAKQNLVKTLLDLQHTLEAKKSQIKEIMESTSSAPPVKEDEPDSEIEKSEEKKNHLQPDVCHPPGLPPRRISRPRSPFHDVPKNNSPVVKQFLTESVQPDYTIDQILDDLEMESKKSDAIANQTEELSVRQLIQKFNHSSFDGDSLAITDVGIVDVLMRQKGDSSNRAIEYAAMNLNADNRHSDELNKLLEELTKVTCAPLMTPGVTSSLVQIKSEPLTDEEWLAIPIRRRRHSEPDYDVPRPHRSLQILPQSPTDEDNDEESAIQATRFFGPVLPPSITHDKSYLESMSWRSMTPDSLEPLQQIQAAIKQQQQRRRNELARSDIENDRRSFEKSVVDNSHTDFKANDHFLDSLEPFSEGATAF